MYHMFKQFACHKSVINPLRVPSIAVHLLKIIPFDIFNINVSISISKLKCMVSVHGVIEDEKFDTIQVHN